MWWCQFIDWSKFETRLISLLHFGTLRKFSKALDGTTGVTYSARVFRPVMGASINNVI